MTKEELLKLLATRQSAILVYPTQQQASDAYFDVTQHKLPEPGDRPINYFPKMLSITQHNPAASRPVILRWMSGKTHPSTIRNMQAVIEFPQGMPPNTSLYDWRNVQAIHERHRMECRICGAPATRTLGEYNDIPTCGATHCGKIAQEGY